MIDFVKSLTDNIIIKKSSLEDIKNYDCKKHFTCNECPCYLDKIVWHKGSNYTCLSVLVLDEFDP